MANLHLYCNYSLLQIVGFITIDKIEKIVISGNRENNKKLGSVFLSVILLLSISIVFSNYAYAQTAPTITLNAEEFVPGQTVEVNGSGFSADYEYAIFVIRPDGWIIKNDRTSGFDSVVSDTQGNFVYEYTLESIAGEYQIFAIDPSNPISDLLGFTTFTNSAPVVTTDKIDYAPDEIVKISGTGFIAGNSYDVVIIRPDGPIIKGDGTFTSGFDTVLSEDGSRSYDYILN